MPPPSTLPCWHKSSMQNTYAVCPPLWLEFCNATSIKNTYFCLYHGTMNTWVTVHLGIVEKSRNLKHEYFAGLRSVRPSQCCPQDCSEEGPSKYHDHHYHFNEASKAKTETLRCYSAASCRIFSTVKKYDTCLRAAAKLHSRSCYNGSPGTESRGSAGYHPKCPPWHWEILQENNKLEEYYSEKEDEEKENRRDWEKTCHFEEWKEVLQSSPTLHALGWVCIMWDGCAITCMSI